MRGAVKFYKHDKGYGFITPADGGKDVFFHINDVRKNFSTEPRSGDVFEFDIVAGREGKPQAQYIRRG